MDQSSRAFQKNRGIKQGCCISPKEFNGALEKIFKKIQWDKFKGIDIDGEKLHELRFADDSLLISQSKDEILQMMETLFEASKEAGLFPNISKTKIMTNTIEDNFSIKDEEIEKVKNYKYLGKIVSFEDSSRMEIEARISAAWRSYWALKTYFKGNFPIHMKKRLMDSCILPVLTYGSQCWKLTDELKERIAVTQRNMERSMMNIKLSDKISNTKIRKKSNIKDIQTTSNELKWSWAGHVQRYQDNRWTIRVENWEPKGRRKPGRPKTRWSDEFHNKASLFWRKKCLNRDKWKLMGNPM